MHALSYRIKMKLRRAWRGWLGLERPPQRRLDRQQLAWLNGGSKTTAASYDACGRLRSCLCTQRLLESPAFTRWATRLDPNSVPADGRIKLHRKTWEHCYIAQALYERDLLRPGARGLGFAVGREPLPAFFASEGCTIVASDVDAEHAREIGWAQTNQHADGLATLNERGLCPAEEFNRLVSYRSVDMNRIPNDLTGFDFCWSSCAFEHLGSIHHGQEFIVNMLNTLKPGGNT